MISLINFVLKYVIFDKNRSLVGLILSKITYFNTKFIRDIITDQNFYFLGE